jgi:hypothetical protein
MLRGAVFILSFSQLCAQVAAKAEGPSPAAAVASSSTLVASNVAVVKKPPPPQVPPPNLGEHARGGQEGVWLCGACTLQNSVGAHACAACGASRGLFLCSSMRTHI